MYNSKCTLIDNLKNKFHENCKMLNFIICAVLVVAYSICIKDYKLCLGLNNIVTIAIILALIYVNIIRAKFVDKTFMKSFEIMYLVLITIIVLNFIDLIAVFENISKIPTFFLYSVQATLEYCFIANILKSKDSNIKSLGVYISNAILFVILFVAVKGSHEVNNEIWILLISISVLLNIVMFISTFHNILINKIKFSNDKYRNIILYMFSIVISYFGFVCLVIGNTIFFTIIIGLKCVIFFKFYDYITSKILEDSLEKISKNIQIATKTKRELNSILKKRNTILNDTSVMIKRSQNKNNKLIDSIYGGVFLFYLNKLQYINKRTLGTLNIDSDELLGMELKDFIKRYFNITLEDIKKSQNYISCVRMKHTNFEVEIFLTCVDENSEILYIHDISELNEDEKIRKVLEEYLEEDKIKKEFFANISHELKTPINIIFSALQVNHIHLKENNIDGIDKNRKMIKQNCLRLIRTINNFIYANKVSEGYIVPDCKIHNMVELVEDIATASNKYIKLIDNTLTFDAEEEEIYVNCDKEMITTIMLNIFSNSVKYGKKGGNINVNVSIYMNDYISIKVKNDGLKIEKEIIPYIFDKFTKLNKAFNRLKEGSGLGLYLTKALVNLQDGSISLTSNDIGNEFIITFPRVDLPYDSELIDGEWETNELEEKVDVEFSDIYIE